MWFFSVFVFYVEIQDGHQKWQKKGFLKKSVVDSADNLGAKNFAKIALSPTISEINTFWQFMQKFKMTDKIGGKMICAKSRQ